MMLFAAILLGGLEAMSFGEVGALGFLTAASILVGLILLVAGGFKRSSVLAGRGVILVGVVVVSMLGSAGIMSAQTEASKRRGNEICVALEAHRARFGAFPEHLAMLHPTGLPEIPATTMGVIRRFEFIYEVRAGGDFYLAFSEPATWTGWCRGRTGPWIHYD